MTWNSAVRGEGKHIPGRYISWGTVPQPDVPVGRSGVVSKEIVVNRIEIALGSRIKGDRAAHEARCLAALRSLPRRIVSSASSNKPGAPRLKRS